MGARSVDGSGCFWTDGVAGCVAIHRSMTTTKMRCSFRFAGVTSSLRQSTGVPYPMTVCACITCAQARVQVEWLDRGSGSGVIQWLYVVHLKLCAAKDLVTKMLTVDPVARLSAHGVLAHHWISSVRDSSLWVWGFGVWNVVCGVWGVCGVGCWCGTPD